MSEIPQADTASLGRSVEEYVTSAAAVKETMALNADGKNLSAEGRGHERLGVPAIADVYTAVDIAMQLKAVISMEPLVLLINPASLQIAYNKIQQHQDRSRHGFVFQAWGEDQPKLTISARCGAFYSGGRGVQFASRRDSAAWQNLMTAFHFYKNNGYIHDTVGKSNAHHFVGVLSIHYDQWVYYGNMESFSYTEEDSHQLGGVTFEMSFVVSAMVDTSKSNTVVQPMRSPVPDVSDTRYTGLQAQGVNRPNTLSVGYTDSFGLEGDVFGFGPGRGGSESAEAPSGFVAVPPSSVKVIPVQGKPVPFFKGRG